MLYSHVRAPPWATGVSRHVCCFIEVGEERYQLQWDMKLMMQSELWNHVHPSEEGPSVFSLLVCLRRSPRVFRFNADESRFNWSASGGLDPDDASWSR